MKKIIVGGAIFVAALAAFRRFGPALGKLAMRKCEQMFDGMPDEFPPKRMMRSIEEIEQQNTRILQHLEAGHERLAVEGPGKGIRAIVVYDGVDDRHQVGQALA